MYARLVLHLGADHLGFLMGASAVGSVIGAIFLISIPHRKRVPVMMLNVCVVACAIFSLSRAPSFYVATGLLILNSLGLAMNFGLANTIIQERAPDYLRGRVSAVFMLSFVGLMPVAGLGVTGLSDLIGMPTALAIAAVCYAVIALIVLARVRRNSRVPRLLKSLLPNRHRQSLLLFSVIAFSTCWNSERHATGEAMLGEIKGALGFDLIELDHSLRMSLMPGVQKMFETGEIRFSSLHNLFPAPAGSPMTSIDCSKFSAVSAEERDRAVTQTLQSIDLAGQLSASFIVLHLGHVNMKPITQRLIAMAKAGEYLSREYVRKKINAVLEREKIAPECLERVKNCLRRIVRMPLQKILGLVWKRGAIMNKFQLRASGTPETR